MDWMVILKFVGCAAASFGSGWATAILSDVDGTKALAAGIVTAAAYVLGNQQTSAKLTK